MKRVPDDRNKMAEESLIDHDQTILPDIDFFRKKKKKEQKTIGPKKHNANLTMYVHNEKMK